MQICHIFKVKVLSTICFKHVELRTISASNQYVTQEHNYYGIDSGTINSVETQDHDCVNTKHKDTQITDNQDTVTTNVMDYKIAFRSETSNNIIEDIAMPTDYTTTQTIEFEVDLSGNNIMLHHEFLEYDIPHGLIGPCGVPVINVSVPIDATTSNTSNSITKKNEEKPSLETTGTSFRETHKHSISGINMKETDEINALNETNMSGIKNNASTSETPNDIHTDSEYEINCDYEDAVYDSSDTIPASADETGEQLRDLFLVHTKTEHPIPTIETMWKEDAKNKKWEVPLGYNVTK